jgi:uncharacterized protein (TIGR02231 family)
MVTLGCFLVGASILSQTGAAPVTAAIDAGAVAPPAVQSVTMYRDRAVVVRGGRYPLRQGANVLRFDGFSPNLKEVSLRARLLDAAGGRIVNVATWTDQRRQIQDAKVRQADERVRGIEAGMQTNRNESARLSTVLDYLEKYRASLRQAISEQTLDASPELAKWREALATVNARHDEIGRALAKTERDRQELDAGRAASMATLKELENPQPKSVRVIEVHMLAERAGDVGLEILYEMSQCGWVPIYEVREQGDGAIRLTYHAGLRQHTEEDWENVKVTLSTAEPAVAAQRPKLSRLAVRTRPLAANESGQSVRMIETRPETAPDIALVQSTHTMEMDVRQEATSFAMELPTPVTIPRDGRLAKVTIAAADLHEKTDLWLAPDVQKHVYRRLKAANPFPIPMLPGEFQAFHRDSYVGAAAMAFAPVAGTFEIATGTDPEIEVKTDDLASSKTSGNDETSTRRKLVRIRNGKKTPIQVTVAYAIPVSEVEEAVVERLDREGSVAPDTFDAKKGHLFWTRKIAPDATDTVCFWYSVSGPRDILNRVALPAPPGSPLPALKR